MYIRKPAVTLSADAHLGGDLRLRITLLNYAGTCGLTKPCIPVLIIHMFQKLNHRGGACGLTHLRHGGWVLGILWSQPPTSTTLQNL